VRLLLVPEEAAEHPAVESWSDDARASGALETLRVVSHVRAPYALRAGGWDAVICDLSRAPGAGLDLLREARAAGSAVPFLLIAAGDVNDARTRAETLGDAVVLDRASLTEADLERAVGELAQSQKPDPEPAAVERAAVEPAAPSTRNADHAPVMLFRLDGTGALTHASRAWTKFTGRSESDERGDAWLNAMPLADRERFARVFGDARGRVVPFELDVRLRHGDGSSRWLRLAAEPRDGGWLGSAFEVTDLVRRAADAVRLERANRDLHQLSYAIAHDLQEPLRALGGVLQAALEGEGDARVPLRRGIATLDRMQAMVRDLIECAAIESAGQDFESADLTAPLEWALSNLAERIEESGAHIQIAPLPVALCDAPQVARVFQNLIGNALKFRADEPPQVQVSAHTRGDVVVVSVRDNGLGIDPAWHAAIFEPFRRAPGVSAPGSGVGLALCKRIVERHGGRLRVRSEPGKGAKFTFSLPARA